MGFSPSRRAVVALVVVIAFVGATLFVLLYPQTQRSPDSIPSQFKVNGMTFRITYVATNESAWEAGLMNKKVTNTTTMLFIFPRSAVYPFWMYHVNSSLDIIWVSAAGGVGRVVYLVPNAPGCSLTLGCPNYTPSSQANFVIEAKGGFAAANGIGVGTSITFG